MQEDNPDPELKPWQRHLRVFGLALVFGLGAYAVIQVMMAISRFFGGVF